MMPFARARARTPHRPQLGDLHMLAVAVLGACKSRARRKQSCMIAYSLETRKSVGSRSRVRGRCLPKRAGLCPRDAAKSRSDSPLFFKCKIIFYF